MEKDIEYIWNDLRDELYAFILKKVKNETIAKDILQEVFIKIQTKIHQLQDMSKLTSWVYQITRTTVIDFFRQQSKTTILTEIPKIPEEDTNEIDYSGLSQCLNQKIETLAHKYKQAIVLTTFKNYSQKELAKHLNLSYSGTKSRVQKAKAILKSEIINCPNSEVDNTGKLLGFNNG